MLRVGLRGSWVVISGVISPLIWVIRVGLSLEILGGSWVVISPLIWVSSPGNIFCFPGGLA